MLPTFVLVVVPVETPSVDTQVLIESCNRVFLAGECLTQPPEDATVNLRADVRWVGSTRAQVTLRFRDRDGERWRSMTRPLNFQSHDEVNERFRSLGLAVGSMAGSAHEVLRVEDEQRNQAAPPVEPAPSTRSEPTALPVDKPATEQAPTDPAATVNPQTLELSPPSTPLRWGGSLRGGLQLGSGMRTARWGAQLGASATVNELWLFDVQAGYGVQATNSDGISADFTNLALGLGVLGASGDWTTGITLGPALQFIEARRVGVKDAINQRWGVELTLHARATQFWLAPYVELRLGWIDPTDVLLDGQKQVFGPWQFQLALGVAFPGETE